jgi:hypothetical protein
VLLQNEIVVWTRAPEEGDELIGLFILLYDGY